MKIHSGIDEEPAIQVATDWQGKGLGRLLLDKLIAYLRERGTVEVAGQCLPENAGMAALARQAGFKVSAGPMPDAIAMQLVLSERSA